jgi:hypothetical protein
MQQNPYDPPPQDEPHDVPVYPEGDPPPAPEKAAGPEPKEGEEEDVDEDDLDPQVPHSPPDGKKRKIVFDENEVTG